MPHRQEPPEPHTPVDTPDGQSLSEQERQALDAAATGIDTAVSALPDDGPALTPPRASGSPETGKPSRTRERHDPAKPLAQAQDHGLVPSPDENAPPLDGTATNR